MTGSPQNNAHPDLDPAASAASAGNPWVKDAWQLVLGTVLVVALVSFGLELPGILS